MGGAIGGQRPIEDEVVPDQPDLAGVRETLFHRHPVQGELAVLAQIGVGRQAVRGLVVVDLVHAPVLPHQAVDVALQLVAPSLVERHGDLVLEPQGGAIVERVMTAVVLADALHTGPAVVIRGQLGPDDRDPVRVVLVPAPVVPGQELVERRDLRLHPIAVQRLQDLVHPVPQKCLDRLRVALDPVEIAVAVLQRAFFVGAQTGVGVDLHAAALDGGRV